MNPRKQVAIAEFDKFMNAKVEIQFQNLEKNQFITDTGIIAGARLISTKSVVDSSFAFVRNNIFIVYFVNDSNQNTSILFEYLKFIKIL